MILDGNLQFDTAANLAQVAGTYTSANALDLHMAGIPVLGAGVGARDIGVGDNPAMKLLVLVTTAFASAGAATLQVKIQGAPDNGAGLEGTYYDMMLSPVFALAALTAGARLLDDDMPRVPAGQPLPRFLRLQYIIGTATTTAGKVESFLVGDRMDQPISSTGLMSAYPAGINIAN